MPETPKRGAGSGDGAGSPARRDPHASRTPHADPELRRLRRRIDALDRRIVALLNERARVGLAVGEAKSNGGGRQVRDPDREREVLLRVAIANEGPLAQADLLAIYRRLIAATRALEAHALRARARSPKPSRPDGDQIG